MLHTLYAGFIAYIKGPEAIRGWNYDLEANLSAGLVPDLPIRYLDSMQRYYGGDLDLKRLDDGSLQIRREIIAHGPESAIRQAEDLRDSFYRFLGLRTNVVRPA